MARKVEVCVFDSDLRVQVLKKELNDSGTRIKFIPEGAGYFMPAIDTNKVLYFPRRKWYPPFTKFYEPVYFVKNKAKSCVDFSTGEVSGEDTEAVEAATAATMLKDIGARKLEVPWYFTAMMGLSLILMFLVANAVGVFR